MTTVLRSGDAEVPGWQLLAGWTDDGHLMNTLQFAGEQPYLAGGFGGPPVWDGHVLNYWYGTGPDESGLIPPRHQRLGQPRPGHHTDTAHRAAPGLWHAIRRLPTSHPRSIGPRRASRLRHSLNASPHRSAYPAAAPNSRRPATARSERSSSA
jgi:hypothetical protein